MQHTSLTNGWRLKSEKELPPEGGSTATITREMQIVTSTGRYFISMQSEKTINANSTM